MKRRLRIWFVVVSTISMALALNVGMASADPGGGAQVDKEKPGVINRTTPSGICLRSHHEASGEGQPLEWEPGQGPGGGNFSDFAAGGGELEFGLVTPSEVFNGAQKHPCE